MVVIENNSVKFKKCALALAVASSLSLATSLAEAAGLGKLTVFSSLGQPLKAEVEIAASSEELSGMTARLAPPEVFKQAGVDFASALSDLQFKVEKRRNGKTVLRLTSVHPVNEPFLDFLVELNWPAGRLVREYTFLLDPPEFAAQQGQRNTVDAKVVETVRGGAAAAPKPAAPAKPKVEEKPAEGSATKTGDDKTHLVAKGDTLVKIARERRYASVSLEQMLVGLYRGNSDAFIGKDINRLKSGVILNVPEESVVAAVSQKEARAVYVSAGDFAAYRRKLAAAAVAAPATKAEAPAGQSSGGKITPKIEEKAPVVDATRDQVKVSRADAPSASVIDRVASEKAMQESQTRLAQLERNIGELQKLLELKNQRLAELEKPAAVAAPAPAPAAKPEAAATKPEPTPPVAEPAAAPTPPLASEGGARVIDANAPAPVEEKPAEPPAQVTPPPAPPKPVAPPPEPPEDPSELEGAMPLLGGAAVLALLGAGWLYSRRRKSAAGPVTQVTAVPAPSSLGPNSVFGVTGGQSIDTGSTPPHTGDFSQAGPGTIDTDEVDPVAEADVYMAYGRDAQAEEILLEAMQKDPNRLAIHVKLLEIYAGRRSLKQFETLASELYALTSGQGPEWEKVAALGAGIDPGNPLYGGAAKEKGFDPDATLVASSAAVAAAAAAAAQPAVAEVVVPAIEVEEAAPAVSAVPVSEPAVVPMVESLVAEPAMPEDDGGMSLDFDLGDTSTEAVTPPEEDVPAPAVEPYVDTVVTGENVADALDFDLSGLVADEAAAAETPAHAGEAADTEDLVVDFDSIDLPDSADFDIAAPMEEAAAPDFSPEGTLVVSGTGLGQMSASDFSFDALRASEPAAAPSVADKLEPVSDALADTGLGEIDHPGLTSTVVNPNGTAGDMDFDVKLSDSVFLGQPMMNSEFDMDAINLDLSVPPPAPAPDAAAEPERDARWEEVNTKLDLAKAYEEMGDLEGARELLQEVLGEGSADLVAQAQEILGRIGG